MRPLAVATGLFVALSAPVADFLLERHDLTRRSQALALDLARTAGAQQQGLREALERAVRTPRSEEIETLRVVGFFSGRLLARIAPMPARARWPTVQSSAAFVLDGRPAKLEVVVGEPEWLRRDLVLLGVFGVLGAALAVALYSFPLRLLREEDLVRLFAWRSQRAAEDERRRLSRDLHDGVGQALGAAAVALVRLQAKSGRPAEALEASRLVDAALDEVRRVARGLRPPTLDDLGLSAALEGLGREASTAGLQVSVEAEPLGRVGAELEQACFRLAQEGLANVVRHARAKRARVRLWRRREEVVLEVEDDGGGFVPGKVLGLGLVGARERAERLGGRFTVDSAPGKGTRLTAVLPWSEA